jgi:hypothetical protein
MTPRFPFNEWFSGRNKVSLRTPTTTLTLVRPELPAERAEIEAD